MSPEFDDVDLWVDEDDPEIVRRCLWHDECFCLDEMAQDSFYSYPRIPIGYLGYEDGWICSYCYRFLDPAEAIREHVEPRSRGGSDLLHNLVVACASCNTRKSNHTIPEWLDREQRRGRLDELPGLRTMAAQHYGVRRRAGDREPSLLLNLLDGVLDRLEAADG